MTQQRYCILIASIFQAAAILAPIPTGMVIALLMSLLWMLQSGRKERHEPA